MMTMLAVLPRFAQRTLCRPAWCAGPGLHSGRNVNLIIRPARPDAGVQFLRRDVRSGTGLVPARIEQLSASDLCTTLSNAHGHGVSTPEHLLAALVACGVDNALVELDGPEVPALDGSARRFVEMILEAGLTHQSRLRRLIVIRKPIAVRLGASRAMLLPSDAPRVTLSIEFTDPAIGVQRIATPLDEETLQREFTDARTFGFISDVAALRDRGLARGASLDNTVVVDDGRVLNPEGLRYSDEFVRHKLLDCVGDVALAGAPVLGHLWAHRPGHALNAELLRKMAANRDAWTLVTADSPARGRTSGSAPHGDEREPVRHPSRRGARNLFAVLAVAVALAFTPPEAVRAADKPAPPPVAGSRVVLAPATGAGLGLRVDYLDYHQLHPRAIDRIGAWEDAGRDGPITERIARSRAGHGVSHVSPAIELRLADSKALVQPYVGGGPVHYIGHSAGAFPEGAAVRRYQPAGLGWQAYGGMRYRLSRSTVLYSEIGHSAGTGYATRYGSSPTDVDLGRTRALLGFSFAF